MVIFFFFAMGLTFYNTYDTPPQYTSKEIYEHNKNTNPMNIQPDDEFEYNNE